MEKVRKGVKKILVLRASLAGKAWVNIILFLLAGVMIGSGVYLRSQPEWTKRADIRWYNQGVSALYLPPGVLPATEERPSEFPVVRAVAYFQQAASKSTDNRLKSFALYNIGTLRGRDALAAMGASTPRLGVAEGISKLAEAVRADPNNEDAKYNLELLEKLQAAVAQEEAGPGPGYSPGTVNKGY